MSWLEKLRRQAARAARSVPVVGDLVPSRYLHDPEQTAARVFEPTGRVAQRSREVLSESPAPQPERFLRRDTVQTVHNDTGAAAATAPVLAPEPTPKPGTPLSIPTFSAAETIGDLYEITEVLGSGRRYTTYRVRHLRWMVDMVLKVPRPDTLQQRGASRAISESAARWTELGLHPHIAYCHYVDTVEGVPVVLAEYAEGENLRSWIVQRKATDLRVGVNLAIQICHALWHAHARGVLHGAVMPENVLVSEQGLVRVTDFWGSGAFGSDARRERRAAPPASGNASPARPAERAAAYVAPEQWVDAAVVDEQTDIFALGVCLYEILCGTRPYEVARGPRREAPPPKHHGEPLPGPLAQLLRRTVDWDHERRVHTVASLCEQLCAVHVQLFGRPSPVAEADTGRCDADGWNNRGLAALLLERPNDADAAWEKALETDPQHVEALYNRGVIRWRRGDLLDDALTHQLAELYESGAHKAAAAYALGLVHLERAAPETAVSFLEEAAEQSPEREDVREMLDVARMRLEEPDPGIAKLTGHRAFVSGVAIADDGRWVLSSGDDDTLCLWDASTRKPVRVLEGHGGRVSAVCMTGDGELGLSGGDDSTLRLWALRSGECQLTIKTPGPVLSVAVSADGSIAVSVCSSGDDFLGVENAAVQVWDLRTKKCVRKLQGHLSTVRAVALTADGRQAVTGGDDQTVRLWNVASGSCLRVFEGHEHYVSSVAIDARGSTILSGAWDQSIRVWETVVGMCRRVLVGHRGIVTALSLSGDGRLAVSGSLDGTVRIWEVASGRCLRTFEGHTSLITGVDLDGEGRLAASGSWDHTVRVWEVKGSEGAITPLQLSRRPAVTEAPLLQPSNDELLVDAEKALGENRLGVALDALRRVRAARGGPSPRATHLWRRLSQRCARDSLNSTATYADLNPKEVLAAVLLGREARFAVTGTREGALSVWSVDLERRVRTLEGHTDRIRDLAVDESGERLLSASADRTLRLWNLESGSCLQTFAAHEGIVSAGRLSADGRLLLSGSYDHTVRLWETNTGRCLRVFEGHTRQVLGVALSEDNEWAASGAYDGELRVWKVSSGECAAVLEGHAGAVTAVSFGADGRLLLSAGADGSLRLWKLGEREGVQVFSGHEAGVCRAVMAADGRWAFSAAEDGTLRLWDLSRGEARVLGKSADVNAAAISPDFCWVGLTEDGGRLHLLELDWNLALAASAAAED